MKTPCVNRCGTHSGNRCTGCGRSLTEICNWITYTDEERDKIMARLRTEGYDQAPEQEKGSSVFARKYTTKALPKLNSI